MLWVVTGEQRTRQQLQTMVAGKDDDGIYAQVGNDVEGVLRDVFDAMVAAFAADRSADASGVVQWNIGTPRGILSYQLVIGEGRCEARKGDGPARVTLNALLPDFLRITAGQLNPMEAYMKRTLTVSGDILFAQRQEAWFDR